MFINFKEAHRITRTLLKEYNNREEISYRATFVLVCRWMAKGDDDMTLKEKILKYYNVEKTDKGLLITSKQTNKRGKIVHLTELKHTLVLFDTDETRKELTRKKSKLLKEGKCVELTGEELIRLFCDEETAEKMELNRIGVDRRTKHYLEKIKKSIGFLDLEEGYDPLQLENVTEIDLYLNLPNPAQVGEVERNGEKLYVCQYTIRTEVDDYDIIKILFNKKPSKKSIKTCDAILDLETQFFMKEKSPTFFCWECGRETHWLDVKGDFWKKLAGLEEKYCGC